MGAVPLARHLYGDSAYNPRRIFPMMNIVFTTTPTTYEMTSGVVFQCSRFGLNDEEAFASELHQFANLADINKAFAEYVERARATGNSLKVNYYKHTRCTARKVRGFDAAAKASAVMVNPTWSDGRPYENIDRTLVA